MVMVTWDGAAETGLGVGVQSFLNLFFVKNMGTPALLC